MQCGHSRQLGLQRQPRHHGLIRSGAFRQRCRTAGDRRILLLFRQPREEGPAPDPAFQTSFNLEQEKRFAQLRATDPKGDGKVSFGRKLCPHAQTGSCNPRSQTGMYFCVDWFSNSDPFRSTTDLKKISYIIIIMRLFSKPSYGYNRHSRQYYRMRNIGQPFHSTDHNPDFRQYSYLTSHRRHPCHSSVHGFQKSRQKNTAYGVRSLVRIFKQTASRSS